MAFVCEAMAQTELGDQLRRARLNPKTKTLLKPDCAQNARWVLDERQIVQDTDQAALQILFAAVRI